MPFSSIWGICSVSTVRSMAAPARRSMETPMPKSFTWLNTRKETTSVISALGSVMLPLRQSATAASIIAALAIWSTASCAAV